MNSTKTLSLLASASLVSLSALAAAPAEDAMAYRTIAGVSPEPILEGAGLKSPEELESFIDGIMAAQLKAQHAAGAIVSVVKDGKVLLAKGYGYADMAKQMPADDNTLFRPGSVSKLFTWTALMQLIEQGKVSLDADVNTYLTQFKVPDTYPGKPITVRNLFTHTEGTEDGGLGYLIIDKAENLDDPAQALAKHIPKRIHPPTTDFATGYNSSYSNWGASLAGLIVANVSGMSFDDYVEKNIFAPLGMTQSTFRQPVPATITAKASIGYKYEAGKYAPQGFEYVNFAPAGSLSSTAQDMAKFMLAHLASAAPLFQKPETMQLMHSRVLSPNPYTNGSCLGFYENHVNGRRLIVHAGDTQFFHSELNLLPAENIGIFYSINSAPSLAFSTRGDLLTAFMDHYFPAKLPVLTPPSDFAQRGARYAGSYRMNRHSHSKNEKVFGLIGAMTVAPTKDNTLVVASGASATQFVEVAPNTFRQLNNDQIMAFAEDEHGQVNYMLNPASMAFIGAYRLPWFEAPGMLMFILGFSLLCFIVAIVSALRHWRADALVGAAPRRARRLAALVGALNLLFLAFFGIAAATLAKAPLAGFPSSFHTALALPLVALVLTLGLLVYALLAWAQRWWTFYGRLQYTLIALASAAFLWALNLANMIGFHFG